ncbi:MAG: DUF937 domain-containing protein [Gemmatimonadales bacterium]|nr:DUF937 domain-containing protein [Gemmatimonadales bacterium]
MELNDLLARTGGLQAIARELGITDAEAAAGAAALAPAIVGGFEKQVEAHPGGNGGLGELLRQFGDDDLLDNVVGPEATDVSRGNSILGQIFGSKEVSRAVAQDAAPRTGLDSSILKKMLPLIAMIVAGQLSRQQKSGAPSAGGGALGGLGGILGSILGGGSGGRNPLDEILGKLGR